jgi:hypothetical protein
MEKLVWMNGHDRGSAVSHRIWKLQFCQLHLSYSFMQTAPYRLRTEKSVSSSRCLGLATRPRELCCDGLCAGELPQNSTVPVAVWYGKLWAVAHPWRSDSTSLELKMDFSPCQ